MEQKFGKNSIDIKALREFCEREGKEVTYRKGDQLEREGDPAQYPPVHYPCGTRQIRLRARTGIPHRQRVLQVWAEQSAKRLL